MKIDIVADTICPWCYIGKRRLERALSQRPQRGLEIFWRPFFLNPAMPREGIDRADYVARKFGGRERANRIYAGINEAGAAEDISFRFDRISRSPNTVDSHRLIHLAGLIDRQDPIVEALYRAYFVEGRDIGDTEVLADIAAAAGMPRQDALDYLRGGADRDVVIAGDEKARSLGVNGVPCFIIDRKYAVSGAQLPEVFHQVFDLVNQEAAAAAE
jgi:predicted DsbA family dithiol-disulfide isomerase